MSETLDAIDHFELNQFTGRYMLHMLARFTDYVDTQMGYASRFSAYIDRTPNTSFDIEHILPDDYPTYREGFNDEEDFQQNRRKCGNLILLTSDHNRSYQAMPYRDKVKNYLSDNILAQSLSPDAYIHNPRFVALKDSLGFKPYPEFGKESIRERVQLYTRLAKQIWNANVIRELAGGWEDETAIRFAIHSGKRYTVEYGAGRSWEDARKWGFVSACNPAASKFENIRPGDMIFCHIAGSGFVGVGVCDTAAVPANHFIVEDDAQSKPILNCIWSDEQTKAALDAQNEIFVGVNWLRTVSIDDGYWEIGMTSVPMVAYMISDQTTHDKVLEHFHIVVAETPD